MYTIHLFIASPVTPTHSLTSTKTYLTTLNMQYPYTPCPRSGCGVKHGAVMIRKLR